MGGREGWPRHRKRERQQGTRGVGGGERGRGWHDPNENSGAASPRIFRGGGWF